MEWERPSNGERSNMVPWIDLYYSAVFGINTLLVDLLIVLIKKKNESL